MSQKQTQKLRSLARRAHILAGTLRAQTDAYQRALELKRTNLQRIAFLQQQLRREDFATARSEIKALEEMNEATAADAAELHVEIERVRALFEPIQNAVDAVVRHSGVTRAELGIDFARGVSSVEPQVAQRLKVESGR